MGKSGTNIAKALGMSYAYFQHTLDRTIEWGIHRMKDAGEPDQVIEHNDTKKHVVKRSVKSTLHFFGELGTAYFDTYEKLKSKKR